MEPPSSSNPYAYAPSLSAGFSQGGFPPVSSQPPPLLYPPGPTEPQPSLPTRAILTSTPRLTESVRGEGQWLNSHYPKYDIPRSASASVFRSETNMMAMNAIPPTQKADAKSASAQPSSGIPPPPESSLDLYELSFGTVAGICAGVFVKKGAKLVAFAFGGIFVLLQYLGSASIVRIDWNRAAKRFEGLFYTTDASGAKKPPTVYSLWNALVSFLTADFQARASFIGGFMLGLRVG
ncbi:hypothetical protein V5O48_012963 [Marasmius crinis-equi]|uniref:FUN14 family protein n=1 Tax=Marasmius crinis-equi TaxID=585013 RepID=A0ABR3F1D8_9AGAR